MIGREIRVQSSRQPLSLLQPFSLLRPFWLGVAETLAVVLATVVGGLVLGAWLARDVAPGGPYPAGMANDRGPDPAVWLVDGFNVLHATLLGGRDRARFWEEPRRAELLGRASAFDDPGAEIWVVFDGPRSAETDIPDAARPTLRQVFAQCADDWLLRRVGAADDPSRVAVVTRDRRLAARAQHRGARIVAPEEFLGRCGG